MTVRSAISKLVQPLYFASAEPDRSTAPQHGPGLEIVPDPGGEKPGMPLWGLGLALLAGLAIGLGVYTSTKATTSEQAVSAPTVVPTVAAEVRDFRKSIRIGGTIGATKFAMIRAPRMRGGRDRGGGGGLTIQSLAEPGSIVQAGDVVAEFESQRTQDQLDTFASTLAQTKALAGTRKAEMLITTETLRQNFRTTKAEAEKSELDLQTAEVRSAIQAEIFDLMAQEGRASSTQLENEVRLQEVADTAESRSLDITVEQDQKRLDRTVADMEKMKLRTPVGGLVVIETMFSRGNFQQASAGDEVYGGATFMRVVDLSNMAVYANLNQADSQMVRMGSSVKVQLDAYPGVEFRGRVRALGAMAVSGGGTGGRRMPGSRGSRGEWLKQVPLEVEILEADERIQPDLSASADIIIEDLNDVLVVPRAALDDSGDATVVWVAQEGGLFAQREVEVGSLSDTEAVIQSGLSAGDVIAERPLEQTTELAMR